MNIEVGAIERIGETYYHAGTVLVDGLEFEFVITEHHDENTDTWDTTIEWSGEDPTRAKFVETEVLEAFDERSHP
jgi:RecJ-like exonuclease